MAAVPQKVLNWLYSVLTSEYHDVNRTYADVARTLSSYSSLSPRTDVYTYENGASALLLLVSGTLPVTFRGAVYRFPISLWIPHAYPRQSPIAYVTAAPGMIIRPGQYISAEGRIYHPYLAQWEGMWDRSTLLDFLAILRDAFAKEPPLVSSQQHARPFSQSQNTPPPLPPLPPEFGSPSSSRPPSTASTQSPSSVPPPPPPKSLEIQGEATGSPSRQPANTQSQNPPTHPPTLPRKPNEYYGPPRQLINGTVTTTQSQGRYTPQRSSSLRNENDQVSLSYQGREPVPATGTRHGTTRIPIGPITPTDAAPQYRPMPPLPPVHSNLQSQPYRSEGALQPGFTPPMSPRDQQQSVRGRQPFTGPDIAPQSREIRPVQDLISSPLEISLSHQTKDSPALSAPPIPPNPEKDALLAALSTKLREQLFQSTEQGQFILPSLHAQQMALQQAAQALQMELGALQSLDSTLAQNEKILHDSIREADHVISSAGTRAVPGVDDVLVAPTVVGGQLYELCAEEGALADTLFVLGRALDKGRIGCDTFIKQTRSLAREQFMKKALIKKIGKGMGLDDPRR
ncbi:UEV-domain-containing protein [Xylona heveae TC161]|uniref:UEV-domain-containing protein n=1 Tax=Xylona heveae (strain CBS 132557 / TC161) TaxID=1328760 RepID=A0A165HJP5_XYLHT|nr:UEV-domain-containing protein [Xylona heveae TC161]KZF23615.1 UEV-domain-containing protein [Xylona heveae TC161]